MEKKDITVDDFKELSREELLELLKQALEGQTVKQPEPGDEDYYLDEDDVEPYTDEERFGSFERWDEDDLKGIVDVIDPNRPKEEKSRRQVLEEEIAREKALEEKKKELRAIQSDKRKVIRERIWKETKENIMAAGEAIAKTITDISKKAKNKLKQYADDYVSKETAIKEYEAAAEAIEAEWKKIYYGIQDEIKELQKIEAAQISNISGLVNKRKKLLQSREQVAANEETKLLEAFKNNDAEGLIQIAEKIGRFNNTKDKFDAKIEEETKKLQQIREDIAKREKELEDELDKKQNEHNDSLARLEEDRDNKLANIPTQNFWQKTIGKIVNKFLEKKNKSQIRKRHIEEIDRMKTEGLSRAQEEVEQHRQEREAREERYDKEYCTEKEKENVGPMTWRERFEASKIDRKQRRQEDIEKQLKEIDERIKREQEELAREKELYNYGEQKIERE